MTRLADMDLNEAQIGHRAEMVEGLKLTLGWVFVAEEIERRKAAVEEKILAGKLDADQYRYYTGLREGLEIALKTPETLIGQPEGGPEDAGRDNDHD